MKWRPFAAGLIAAAKLAVAILIMLAGAHAWGINQNAPTVADSSTCHYSNKIFQEDTLTLHQRVPTFFRLMPSRYVGILQAERGYRCVGTTTIAFNGHVYSQAGMGDDPGIAELIPAISAWTGLSLANAFDATVFAVISLGILIGYSGFYRMFPRHRLRWAGAGLFFCIGLLEAQVANVHVFQSSPLVAGIPWLLYFAFSNRILALNVGAAVLAFCCSWCSLVRIGTSLICMAFLITFFVLRWRVQRIVLPLLLILLACFPSVLFERSLITRRDALLEGLGEKVTVDNTHTIWHSIYIGLAFISNAEVPEYNDTIGMDRVQAIDPTARYTSARYDAILRHEVLTLAEHRPLLLIENLAAKAGIVLLLVLALLFPARRAFFYGRNVLWMDAAFLAAILVSAMNAILVIPRIPYLLTLVCLTSLYSCTKLCRALSLSIADGQGAAQEQSARSALAAIELQGKHPSGDKRQRKIVGNRRIPMDKDVKSAK